jgi:hypothetical protein
MARDPFVTNAFTTVLTMFHQTISAPSLAVVKREIQSIMMKVCEPSLSQSKKKRKTNNQKNYFRSIRVHLIIWFYYIKVFIVNTDIWHVATRHAPPEPRAAHGRTAPRADQPAHRLSHYGETHGLPAALRIIPKIKGMRKGKEERRKRRGRKL